MVYSIFCLLEKDLEDNKKVKGRLIIFDCQSAQIRIRCNSRIHFHSLKQFATNELKQHWKSWMERCLENTEDQVLQLYLSSFSLTFCDRSKHKQTRKKMQRNANSWISNMGTYNFVGICGEIYFILRLKYKHLSLEFF